MLIGVLSEQHPTDKRVCLTPDGARMLSLEGNEVVVESAAGESARFRDEEYRAAGAQVLYDREEVIGRAQLLLKVSPLKPAEVSLLRRDQAVMAFHHLAAASREMVDALLTQGVTLIGYEIIEDEQRDLPVLHSMSEIAGQLSVHVAAHYLETRSGGRGILLGGATGIPPAHIVIIGAGTVGLWAARTGAGNRAQVTLLDNSHQALRRAEESLGRLAITEIAHRASISRAASYADVLVGAVLVRGGRAPQIVTRSMVEGMKPGAVIVDVAIDQGGCVETARPTTLEDPVYVEEGVTHYAVPNMTSAVARTASVALSHAAVPFIKTISEAGLDAALRENRGLGAGVYAYKGTLVSENVGLTYGIKHERLADLVGTPDYPGGVFA